MGSGWLTPWAIWKKAESKWKFASDGDSVIPAWEFPNRSGYVQVNSQEKPVYCEVYPLVLANVADAIVAAEALNAAIPITCTIAIQPDVARTLTWAFTSHVNITAFTLVFTFIDSSGKTVVETFTQADGWTGETARSCALLTSVIMTARTGTGVGDTLNVGTGSSLGIGNPIKAITDVFKVSKSQAGVMADYSGAANVTVDVTNQNVDVSTGVAIVDGDVFTLFYKSS